MSTAVKPPLSPDVSTSQQVTVSREIAFSLAASTTSETLKLQDLHRDEATGLLQVLHQPDFRTKWLPRFVLLGYLAFIFMLTHLPIKPSSMPAQVNDKVVHFCMYFGLAFLLPQWYGWRGSLSWKGIGCGLLFLLGYAIADELLQIPVGRTCDFFDGVADMTGGACGLLTAALWRSSWGERLFTLSKSFFTRWFPTPSTQG